MGLGALHQVRQVVQFCTDRSVDQTRAHLELQAADQGGVDFNINGDAAAKRLGDGAFEVERLVFRDRLGDARDANGDAKGAVKAWSRAVELEPRNSVINDHLGDAYWAAGREREA